MPSTRDELVRLARAEVARFEAQRALIDAALSSLRNLLELYNGKPSATSDRLHIKTTGRGGPSPQYDWDHGRVLWDQGKTTKDIAQVLDCPEATVKSAQRRYGWPTAGPGNDRTGRRPTINWTEARRLWDEGLTAHEIAERMGVEEKTIYNGAEYRDWTARTREGKLVPKAVVSKKKGHPASANHPWRHQVIGGAAHDWDLGLRLWNEQKPVPEIAKAVGVTEAAVYYHSKKWPKRPEQPRTGRAPAGDGKVERDQVKAPVTSRRMLKHPVLCPNCGQQTWADPCHGCNTVLPTSLGGVGTRRTAEEEE
jgi:hypothetical protein